jgi:hypothetical protein
MQTSRAEKVGAQECKIETPREKRLAMVQAESTALEFRFQFREVMRRRPAAIVSVVAAGDKTVS